MDSERWDRIRNLLNEALERPKPDRKAFIHEAAGGDAELEAEVLSLLDAHAEEGPLERMAEAWTSPLLAKLWAPLTQGDRVGPYRIERLIGSGGMGSVYLASREDPDLEQRVALKIVKSGWFGEEVVRKFLEERQILARLEHPNIARLFDGGVTENGQPYFAMEYVEGEAIDSYSDRHQLTIADRLHLFATVCDAVQQAHQSLVVHRDLKPSNIVVSEAGQPKLLDFGIAKVLEPGERPEDLTVTGRRWLTPDYASPEQVRGEPVTTASDVYSLGALLYLLLTGRPAYRITTSVPIEVERIICERDPVRPSTAVRPKTRGSEEQDFDIGSAAEARGMRAESLGKHLAGDLDTIVLKAMAKGPDQRYASAAELRDDVRRFLDGMPVKARPATAWYRASKFIRRHAFATAASAVAAISLVVGVSGTFWQAQRATAEAEIAKTERDRARTEAAKAEQVTQFLVELFASSDPSRTRGETITAREVLDRGVERIEQDLESVPDVRANVQLTVGRVYSSLGLYGDAERELNRALDTLRELPESEPAVLAQNLFALARVHLARAELDAGEALIREAVKVLEAAGLKDAARAEMTTDLAWLVHGRGRSDESGPLFEEALELWQQVGSPPRDVAHVLSGLAALAHSRGDFDGAAQYFRRATDLHRSVPGEPVPEAARGLEQLASIYQYRNDFEAAEPLFREALEIRKRLYGDDHPEVAQSLQSLGRLLIVRSSPVDAEPLLRRALEIFSKTLGPDNVNVAHSRQGLAMALLRLERPREAENEVLEALRIHRQTYGEEHAFAINALIQLAETQKAGRRYDRAGHSYSQAETLSRSAFGDEHAYTGAALHGRGLVALELGNAQTAEQLLDEAQASASASLRPGHRLICGIQVALGRSLAMQGEEQRGEELIRQGLEGQRKAFPEGHLTVARTLLALAELLAADGRHAEALPLIEEALAARTAALPEGHSQLAQARERLAASRRAVGRAGA